MIKWLAAAAAALALATSANAQVQAPEVELWRLDCGTLTIKEFNSFFFDTLEAKPGPRDVVNSCYLVRHQDQYLLWDSGLPAALIGKPNESPLLIASMTTTIADQLKQLNLTPADIDVVGISHGHFDHTGQAAAFPGARLVVGKGDFAGAAGESDPFGPWRAAGANVTQATGDVDIFGDGSVVAIHLPGHTPNHLALRVNLASGPVLLSGDLYHSTESRALKGIPPFNTSRADTLAAIDRFERLAKSQNAKVIIQHEPADIAKLPAFPQAAR
ncbi:MAG TPA: N-acyl homoserine lactonase family protein [Sphingomicrobium sp.]|nr:N-acyl homoserine lactonase family protein [Sphingomicrobium sp.]